MVWDPFLMYLHASELAIRDKCSIYNEK
ncbi:hypothetical protein KP509_24G068600 [Ceratopteris richardii]|uniref:Uncharacterized protein n=1 Tax=Ceratopteris richardii TaxID=49495 RepID=A0A8T2RYM7_CERRI|nr:hypothetical protein KP509_24G068600 [Ceratopteris richardii]